LISLINSLSITIILLYVGDFFKENLFNMLDFWFGGFFFFFEMGSHYVAQLALNVILLLSLLEFWDYRCALPHSAHFFLFLDINLHSLLKESFRKQLL
jgi:hypothetical protein